MFWYSIYVLYLCLTLSHSNLIDPTLDEKWKQYKITFHKNYTTVIQENIRRLVWENNFLKHKKQNLAYINGEQTYYVQENQFSDLSEEEFQQLFNPMNQEIPKTGKHNILLTTSNNALPDYLNWAEQGYVTSVKNQGICGCCWAFSATGAIEGQLFKATGKLVSLSEQNLVDCSFAYGNKACKGGNAYYAFQYIIDNGGIDTENSYPYTSTRTTNIFNSAGRCKYSSENNGAVLRDFNYEFNITEATLQQWVNTYGPLSVQFNVLASFQSYTDGVYYDAKCSPSNVNHQILLVGYGTDNIYGDYWLIKNQWAQTWGIKGYAKIARNRGDLCGLTTLVLVPFVTVPINIVTNSATSVLTTNAITKTSTYVTAVVTTNTTNTTQNFHTTAKLLTGAPQAITESNQNQKRQIRSTANISYVNIYSMTIFNLIVIINFLLS